MNWQAIKVSDNNTHFLFEGKAIFDKNFIEVLKFHSPGIAPVKDISGAYHIDSNGNEIYQNRYARTFGFYCNRAAVIENNQWFHINEKGERIYSNYYLWTGNYQENRCTVRDLKNNYFHIDLLGNRLYIEEYSYAGDFKDGVACVKSQDGLFRHINQNGNLINNKSFLDLGVFHKNFATAKDAKGWFHIDKNGDELYPERYMFAEPFYNGFALATKSDNSKLIINEQGGKICTL
ncbi:WG repeat-containing protein [Flavobacterium lacus]|uniref:WG repeat protein n=1 Tax=Flavobacterium lacus TaxID=1353778 RepID=A0A328WQ48_9FLAO|nr:WG repeat-containing protein [Flavobacterium lacus]RAR46477.1 WG repeat protein [Flavobacterium lacus]